MVARYLRRARRGLISRLIECGRHAILIACAKGGRPVPIGKMLKWLVAPAPSYPERQPNRTADGYGRKSADRNWYKIEGTFPIKYSGEPEYAVVGESHRQEAIQRVIGGHYDLGVYWHVVAQLCFVEDNPHDRNAVGVFIESQLVGYIPASDAAQVRQEIIAANPKELPVICKAMIRGGFMKGNKRADYGVTIGLSFPIQEQLQPKKSKKTV